MPLLRRCCLQQVSSPFVVIYLGLHVRQKTVGIQIFLKTQRTFKDETFKTIREIEKANDYFVIYVLKKD